MNSHKHAWAAWTALMLMIAVASASIINQSNETANNETSQVNISLDISPDILTDDNYSENLSENTVMSLNETLENISIQQPRTNESNNTELLIEESPDDDIMQTLVYESYIFSGTTVNVASRNILIVEDSLNNDQIFNITSSSDLHVVGDFDETKEWAYEKSGTETVTSTEAMVLIGEHICLKSSHVRNKGTLKQKRTYPDCVYYPPHNIQVELPNTDGTNTFEKQTRQIEQISDKEIRISFEDDYDPTLEEFEVGLVSYYTFDNNESDVYGDNDGDNHGASLTTGKINNGYYFDGATDYIEFFNIDDTANWSYSLWVKVNNKVGTGANEILNGGSHNPRLVFNGDDVEYQGYYKNSSGDYQAGYVESGTLTYNEWDHLVLVHNITHMLLYVDNGLIDTVPLNGGMLSSSSLLRLGYAWGEPINGTIDEFGVWNRVLTEDEIAQLYNDGNGLQYPFEYRIFLGGQR